MSLPKEETEEKCLGLKSSSTYGHTGVYMCGRGGGGDGVE